jgi:ankyrin repeat protein
MAQLQRIEAGTNSTSMRQGPSGGATDFQFGVYVNGTLDQKIDQLEREARLLRFARDVFPPLMTEISYSGTNRLISTCLADLNEKVKTPIPIKLGANDFRTKEFVFENAPLMKVLKYLVAFDDSILDVEEGKLVYRSARQALALKEAEYNLLRMMQQRRFAEVESLLAKDSVTAAPIQDAVGRNLLHLAAEQNQPAIAKRLLELRVNIDAKDSVGYTPLHSAVRAGHIECAELFLKRGADITLADNNGNTALETAVYFGYRDFARRLVEKGAKPDIFTASGLGLVDEVKKLLEEQNRVEQAKRGANSASSGTGGVYSISFSQTKSPGGYYRGAFKVTPLHWAARGGSAEVATFLVSRGQSVNAKDSRGEAPLFWAVDSGQIETARFLIERGAEVNATNVFGSTPLITSARATPSPKIVRLLLSSGAKANARNNNGENALHQLAWFGYPQENVESAQLLLEAGADIRAKTVDGKTPLDILLDNSMRNEDLVQLYRKYADKSSSKR